MSLQVIKATNRIAIDIIRPKLLPDAGFPPEVWESVIEESLTYSPDRIHILLAFDDEFGNTAEKAFVGFLLGGHDPQQNHTFIYQMWVDPKAKGASNKLFFRFQSWTESLGKNLIRSETTRSPEALFRRAGFETFSTIIQYDTTKGFTNIPDPELEDVTEQQSIDEHSPDFSTASSAEAASSSVEEGSE